MQFRKKGNKKQCRFNQTIAYHLDALKDGLSKINLKAINPSMAKNLENASAELGKGHKETIACQKRIRIVDCSKATVEAYESDKFCQLGWFL